MLSDVQKNALDFRKIQDIMKLKDKYPVHRKKTTGFVPDYFLHFNYTDSVENKKDH